MSAYLPGLRGRTRKGRDPRAASIAAWKAEGATVADIAARLGVSAERVRQIAGRDRFLTELAALPWPLPDDFPVASLPRAVVPASLRDSRLTVAEALSVVEVSPHWRYGYARLRDGIEHVRRRLAEERER